MIGRQNLAKLAGVRTDLARFQPNLTRFCFWPKSAKFGQYNWNMDRWNSAMATGRRRIPFFAIVIFLYTPNTKKYFRINHFS
jgi:hypothetical protein